MPLPIIIGAAALAAAAFGAKKGYDGYQKHSEANEIVEIANNRYKIRKETLDSQEKSTQFSLNRLGKMKLDIGMKFNEFKTLSDSLLSKLNECRQDKLECNIPKCELEKVEDYSCTAIGVLSGLAGAGATGAAAGFAVYGGVMALGAASTGTAISSLAGAAATNATLAAIGGGSLASGGLGIAGGTTILGAAVAAPVLAIAGWAYDNHGKESLINAEKINANVEEILIKLDKSKKLLSDTEEYSHKIEQTLSSLYRQFNHYFSSLQDIDKFINGIKGRNVDVEAEIAKCGNSILKMVENGYALAAIMTDIIVTPILKLKTIYGMASLDEYGVPEMQKNTDGLAILNKDALDMVLTKAADSYRI